MSLQRVSHTVELDRLQPIPLIYRPIRERPKPARQPLAFRLTSTCGEQPERDLQRRDRLAQLPDVAFDIELSSRRSLHAMPSILLHPIRASVRQDPAPIGFVVSR